MGENYFQALNGNKGIVFMDGATKVDLKTIVGVPVHIDDFGFIQGESSEFACLHIAEYPAHFFFGNAIITDMLHTVDEDNMRDALKSQPIVFSMHTSKKGREYMGYEFVDPDSAEVAPF